MRRRLATIGGATAYPFLDYVFQPIESQNLSRREKIPARLRSVTGIYAKHFVGQRAITARSLRDHCAVTAMNGNPIRPLATARAAATTAAHRVAASPAARDSTAMGLAAAGADSAAGAGFGSAAIGSADAEPAARDSAPMGPPAGPLMVSREGATAGGRARGVPHGSMGPPKDPAKGQKHDRMAG